MENTMNTTETKIRKERNNRSAREKCQAVLAIWTQRRRPGEVCRELGVPANLLNSWQERALEGMLAALTPRSRRLEDRGPWLHPRLEKLLDRKLNRLELRLAKLGAKSRLPAEKPPATG
jgi:transposase-like protein